MATVGYTLLALGSVIVGYVAALYLTSNKGYKVIKVNKTNLEIVRLIRKYIIANPELRFDQALFALGIINVDITSGKPVIVDNFYRKSTDVLNIIKSRMEN